MAHSRGIPEPSEYGKFARRILRGYGRRIADADPEDLADLIKLSGELDELIRATIETGRKRWDWTWEDIGRAAGTGRSAAFQRWGRNPKGPADDDAQASPGDDHMCAYGCQHPSHALAPR